ncbi:flagellin [uncultured Fretibacterium sp.]|uniref:flagellin N-terminal helical domain-containing protein n=1 Tax=uncultured Fretibacterium sp. TaxID=1678694 RepID=UPI00325FBFAB
MVVNHNIPALISYNAVSRTNNALQKSIQKLSTGLRINSAADDAAGLAISEKMRAQIRGLDRAVANSQDGISMIQTAEGALNETHSILQRMRELSVQAANDTLTQQDRGYIQLEIDQLREEITRIGNTTQFNKKKLLNGDAAVLWSSDNLKTKAIINGGLRQIDQFGQKNAIEGNYNIKIKAEAGQSEVKKSDIFKIKHKDVLMNVSTNKANGVDSVKTDNLPAGTYNIDAFTAVPAGNKAVLTGQYGFDPKPVGKQVLVGTATIVNGGNAGTIGDSKYYAGKTLTFRMGSSEATITLDAGTTDTQADLATAIQGKLTGLGGLWADVTVTQTGGKFTLTKPDTVGVLEEQKIQATNTDAQSIFGTGSSEWTAHASNTLKLDQQLGVTVNAPSKNANVLLEVTDVNTAAKSITMKVTANAIDAKGVTSTKTQEVTLTEGTDISVLGDLLGDDKVKLTLKANMTDTFKKGNKLVYNIASGVDADISVKVKGTANSKWEQSWGKITDDEVTYGLKADDVKNKELHFKNFYLNSKNGKVYEGDIVLSTNNNKMEGTAAGKPLASFEVGFVGQVARSDVKLRDLDKFWDAQGRFMLKDAQTLTLTQGDGKQAKVTLYANDTLGDVARKLNEAIGTGLGQSAYVDNAGNFAVFVNKDGGEGSESVAGTFVIRSVIPGATGKLSFAGDEDLVKALSLNVIQNSKESDYSVDITDAHTGKVVVSGAKTTGNKLIGTLHSNIDVEFDAMAGIIAKWDYAKKQYVYDSSNDYRTVLHLADNTTVFQIGANEGEDMGINIGDMRAHALGLNEVLVTDRESAARSITVIDNALDRVSTQRAKLGAYQNRLEHTINNLTVAGENMTAAESRIRDTDMAKEMMNFTKLNIMLQAGNAMLAQANQLPQNVLSLIR